MRVLIDLQGAQNNSRNRGIGRYLSSLMKALVRKSGDNEIYVLVNKSLSDGASDFNDYIASFLPRDHLIEFRSLADVSGSVIGNRGRRLLAESMREKIIEELAPDFLIVGSLFEGYRDDTVVSVSRGNLHVPVGVVVYDFIPYEQPGSYLSDTLEYEWYFEKLKQLKNADLLFSISEFTRTRALDVLEVSPGKVVNISSAIDFSVETDIEKNTADLVCNKFGIKDKYLMHVGALDARKNFEGLIKAFALLPEALQAEFQLVLVCNANPTQVSEFQNFAESLGIKKHRLVMTGHISDTDLVALYSNCHLFVFPSLQEGFGLPPLEAMRFGVPTIGSSISSIPEVIGLDTALFNPLLPDDISRLIQECLTNPDLYGKLAKHAKTQSQKFTWDSVAEKLYAAIENLLVSSGGEKIYPDIFASTEKFISRAQSVASTEKISDADQLAAAKAVFSNEEKIVRLFSSADYGGQLKWRIDGPFDNSYSLAILNRETARALEKLGHFVVLNSPDYTPDEKFLRDNHDIAVMNARVADFDGPAVDVLSRNNYPPLVEDMNSSTNILHHYAWEESGYPIKWVNNFNLHLKGMTCLARHVKKIMIDNGVNVPLLTSGCGVDHWERIRSHGTVNIEAKEFRFLHVSSCFPRKGVDLLLDAYGKAFTSRDNVTLIIKTFSNIHNEVHKWLSERSSARNDYPHVVIIESDISEGELKALYEYSHVLVAPSKAEGFGLPMAEAMLTGLPVITTAWGGQLDFCAPENSWLVNYEFEYSDTHFKLFDSVWAKVDVDDLTHAMLEAYSLDKNELQAMARNGRKFLFDNFKWEDAAARAVFAARKFNEFAKISESPKIGWLTTWNTKCGIATYAEHLVNSMPSAHVVFSRDTDEPLDPKDRLGVPCWRIGNDEIDGLAKVDYEIKSRGVNTVIVQFNYGLFNFKSLASFINRQVDNGVNVIVTMHATGEHIVDHLREAFARCSRILVHSVRDLNNLKKYGLVDNVALFPHGMIVGQSPALNKINKIPLVSSFGFCLPHKGIVEIIEAVSLLNKQGTPVRLRLVNAQYPAEASRALAEHIKLKIAENSLQNLVEFNDEFLSDEESLALLKEADLIVFAYQNTGESASGAVRYGMATGKPVLVTPLRIFDDLGDAVFKTAGVTVADIAEGIRQCISDIKNSSKNYVYCSERAEAWRDSHDYAIIGLRLLNICKALINERRLIDVYPR